MKRFLAFSASLLMLPAVCSASPSSDIEKKVSALMSKMTVEEKIGQLFQSDGEANGNARPEHFELARKGLLGSTLNVRGVKRVNELQKAALESRLGIPIFFAFDVIHGYRTIFPVPLGEAASWDPSVAEEGAAVAASEARAAGVRWTFAPMVDIARDPRWGRMVEGSGEDTYLGSAFAAARVRGFQGSDYSAPGKVAACAKHFAGYGAAEGGRDYNTTDISEHRLRSVYFPPFKAAADAGVATFMTAFNDLNGVPCTANRWLFTDILRGEWGFSGLVVSDYTAIEELVKHRIAKDNYQAAALALKAGVDMEMVSRLYSGNIQQLLKDGNVSMKELNSAVANVLRVKFKAGIFDSPYADPAVESSSLLTAENLAAARRSAVKSFVLLKNEGPLLPLSGKIGRIAVIGALAADREAAMGSWNGDGQAADVVTILDGIKARAGENIRVDFARGSGPEDHAGDDIRAAVKAAKKADVVIVVVGEGPLMSGEAASRSSLSLPGKQAELLAAIAETEKPVVMLLMSGRPLDLSWTAYKFPAIMEIWFPGTMAGPAVADVLFGDVSPGGKLPVTWVNNVGQIPLYYNAKSTGRPYAPGNKYTSHYFDGPNEPLYPFGHGLSYSTFTLSDLSLSTGAVRQRDSLAVSVRLTNTGAREADEVVQLYISACSGSVTRPVRELKGFRRVTLKPGQGEEVRFTLGPAELGVVRSDMKFAVEPGEFSVWVGTSSVGGLEESFSVVR